MTALPLVYDADCGFCQFMLAKLLAWDRHRRLRPVALQDAEADELLGAMPDELRWRSWHLVLPGGEIRSGGHAFAPLLELLPGGRCLAALPAAAPRLADRCYRLVADRRSTLGRRVSQASRERARQRIAERSCPPLPPDGHASCAAATTGV